MSSRAKILWGILIFLPPIFLLYWIVQFTIDMPYLDEWDLVPYLQQSFAGTLKLGDLFDQHNESRLFFPRLLLIPLARLTGWNIHTEVVGIILLAALIFLLLARQCVHTCRDTTGLNYPWLALIISFLIFSVFQYEAWTFGFTIIGFMNIAAVVLGLVLLAHPVFTWPRFLAALLAGVIAMYSYSNGILYWIVALLPLYMQSKEKRRFRIAPWILWLACALLLLIPFYIGYQKPSCMPPLAFFIYHPDVFLGYIFAFLGGALVNTPQMPIGAPVTAGALGCGVFALIALAGLLYSHRTFRALSFWLALGGYALAGALAVALGRSANGIPHALESRYTTLSNLFWISTLVMTVIALESAGGAQLAPRLRRGLAGLKIILLLFMAAGAGLFLLSSASLLTLWHQKHDVLLSVRDELLCEAPDQSLLARSFPDPVKLKARMDFLTQRRLSVFREKKSFEDYKTIDVQAGKIESTRPNPLPAKGFQPNTFTINGLACDPGRRKSARAVLFVNTNGLVVARTHINAVSPFNLSSWKLPLSTAKFPGGPVRLNVYALLQDNELIVPIGVLDLNIPPPVDPAVLAPIEFTDPAPDIAGCADYFRVAENQVYGCGWARNPATNGLGLWVIVVDEMQKILAYARVGEDRDDVARQLGNPAMIRSGWRIAFHQSRLSPGKHRLQAYLFLPDESKALQLLNAFDVIIP